MDLITKNHFLAANTIFLVFLRKESLTTQVIYKIILTLNKVVNLQRFVLLMTLRESAKQESRESVSQQMMPTEICKECMLLLEVMALTCLPRMSAMICL